MSWGTFNGIVLVASLFIGPIAIVVGLAGIKYMECVEEARRRRRCDL